MVPIYEARTILYQWNATQPREKRVALETVEECLNAFKGWQIAVATYMPPDIAMFRLMRHHEFLRQLPNALLLLLSDEYDDTND